MPLRSHHKLLGRACVRACVWGLRLCCVITHSSERSLHRMFCFCMLPVFHPVISTCCMSPTFDKAVMLLVVVAQIGALANVCGHYHHLFILSRMVYQTKSRKSVCRVSLFCMGVVWSLHHHSISHGYVAPSQPCFACRPCHLHLMAMLVPDEFRRMWPLNFF